MVHEAHVRLVDAHAEGVGRRDNAQVPADEAFLHVLLDLQRHAGVEVVRRHVLQLQELHHLLAAPARRTIDDGTTRGIWRRWDSSTNGKSFSTNSAALIVFRPQSVIACAPPESARKRKSAPNPQALVGWGRRTAPILTKYTQNSPNTHAQLTNILV